MLSSFSSRLKVQISTLAQGFQGLSVKTKRATVAAFGLLGLAFAAYGVAPDDSSSETPALKRQSITEAVIPTLNSKATAAMATAPTPSAVGDENRQPLGILSLAPRLDRYLQAERVRKGDSIANVLSRMGAHDPELIKFIAKNPSAQPFAKIQTGRTVQAELGADGKIFSLHYLQPALDDEDGSVTPGTRFSLLRGDEGFVVKHETSQLSTYTDTKVFAIRSTLAAAADSAKIPESVANQIVDLFSDVIDFEKEARRGDRVKVIYQTVADAQSLDAPVPGRVMAVEWISGKRAYTALWFGDAKSPDSGEYYGFDGKSLRKSFLRYPIEFARISSEFSESRKHPIFKDWRAHKGVDFAAPLGTKVRATGDGSIEFIGAQRGYGNVVTIKHGKYSTTYAHLNQFTDGLQVGSKIKQGDVVGFVGRTGFATGPHLHYEFKVDGEHADPLTAELPTRGPLDTANKKLLAGQAEQIKSLLAQIGASKVAQFQ
jgi:murein DD-endopeptidase MepM/ murein hydrolase activator NlpD